MMMEKSINLRRTDNCNRTYTYLFPDSLIDHCFSAPVIRRNLKGYHDVPTWSFYGLDNMQYERFFRNLSDVPGTVKIYIYIMRVFFITHNVQYVVHGGSASWRRTIH